MTNCGEGNWLVIGVVAFAVLLLVGFPLLSQIRGDSDAQATLPTEHAATTRAEETTATPREYPANGGFEEGAGTPANWNQGQPVDGLAYVYTRNMAYSGSASLGFTKTAQNYWPIASWDQQIVLAKPARSITVSAWVRAESAQKATVDVQWPGGHEWAVYIGAKNDGDPPAHHDWTQYSGTVRFPSPTDRFALALQMCGPGNVLFDDVRVTTAL